MGSRHADLGGLFLFCLSATAARIMACANSVSPQAVRLGFLPHLRTRQTSQQEYGQVYVPSINWSLFVAVLAVTKSFRASARLATAYGVAVTGTFLITTLPFLAVAANVPHIPWDERLTVSELGDPTNGITRVDAQFGFQNLTDFPEVLRRVVAPEPEARDAVDAHD